MAESHKTGEWFFVSHITIECKKILGTETSNIARKAIVEKYTKQ